MPDDIINDALSDVEEAIIEARETAVETVLDADARAREAARLDALERRLAAMEASGPSVPMPADVAPESGAGEATDAITEAAERLADAAEAIASTATTPVETGADAIDDVTDTTQQAAETAVEEVVEQLPKRSHFLFRNPFKRD